MTTLSVPPSTSTGDVADSLFTRITERSARVIVVGQGYVGLPMAMRAVEVGFPVVGFDVSEAKIAALRSGRSYIEDVSDATIAQAVRSGYRATSDHRDLRGFDIAVISVPTPLRDGMPDLAFVEDAARDLRNWLKIGSLVILESTTYPGTTEELVKPILEESGLVAGRDFLLGYSPERIDPGNTKYTFVSTPKVVSGIDEGSLRCVDAFYSALVDTTVPVATTGEAELVKLLENTFRHVNIALVNELAMFARDLGVDIWNAIDAASTKPFGYMRFTPGPGVGGHCLPIDPSYLAWRVRRRLGHTFRFVELANDVNEHMPEYVATRVTAMLNQRSMAVKGTRILLLGMAYKSGTSDWRESPSIHVAERLLLLGADLRACEPHLPLETDLGIDVPLVECTSEEIAAADLVIVLVDHPDFPYDELCAQGTLVLDTKGKMRGRSFTGEIL